MNESIRRLREVFRGCTIGFAPQRTVATVLAIGLLLATTNVTMGAGFQGDTVGCAYDRPCFDNVYDAVNDGLVIQWRGQHNYDKYHFQWSHPGGPVHQFELRGGERGQFVIRQAWKSTPYHFAVQGCDSVLIGHDNCSPFEDGSFKTNGI